MLLNDVHSALAMKVDVISDQSTPSDGGFNGNDQAISQFFSYFVCFRRYDQKILTSFVESFPI